MAGIEERRSSLTRLLSGGWKQRLALGCAILHEPPILFLDEPTSGVDPIARRTFWDLIYQLSAPATPSSSPPTTWTKPNIATALALMYRGKVIALGTPAELKQSLGSHHLLLLEVSDIVSQHEAAGEVPGVTDVAVFGGGLHVTVERCERDSADPPGAGRSRHSSPHSGADRAVHGRRVRRHDRARKRGKPHELPQTEGCYEERTAAHRARRPQPVSGAGASAGDAAAVRLRAHAGRGPHPHLRLRPGSDAPEPRTDRPVPRLALFPDLTRRARLQDHRARHRSEHHPAQHRGSQGLRASICWPARKPTCRC